MVELKVLRMRLAQGKENKAKRGEVYPRLPPGYVWDATDKVVKDPNLRVQEAIDSVFAKFRETWSIRQTFKWFRDNDVELPVSKLGRRTGKGKPWSRTAVKSARSTYGIDGHRRSPDDPEVLTLQGAARYTGTSDTTIKKLVDAGIVPMRQLVPFAPWEIQRADLDVERVRAIVERLKRTGKLVLGDTSEKQSELFQ